MYCIIFLFIFYKKCVKEFCKFNKLFNHADTPNLLAKKDAPSTKKSTPLTSKTKPMGNKRYVRIINQVFY